MCIICNLDGTDEGLRAASRFLDAYQKAQAAMKTATEAMAECSKINPRYDPTHKAMVRVMRDWNALEHQRELTPPRPDHQSTHHKSAPQEGKV